MKKRINLYRKPQLAGHYDYTYTFSSMHKYKVNCLYFFPLFPILFLSSRNITMNSLEEEASNVFSGKVTYIYYWQEQCIVINCFWSTPNSRKIWRLYQYFIWSTLLNRISSLNLPQTYKPILSFQENADVNGHHSQ